MFRQGLYNTALLLAIGMPLLFALALAIALRVQTLRRGRGVILALLLLPLMVPAAVTSHFWQSTFAVNGLINRVLYDLNLPLLNFASSRWALLVPLLIYLWKHIGMAVLLFYTGLQRIPRQYYEQAACSGANQGQQLRRVTWPYLAPTSLVVFILSFIGILPQSLSGGQKQRVALGRALVCDADVFLFDEPLANLDAKLRAQMRIELIRLQQQLQSTFIYVTHDQTEALTMGHRIVVMRDGIIQQVGTPQELYYKPTNAFVARFIGSPPMNLLPGEVQLEGGNLYL